MGDAPGLFPRTPTASVSSTGTHGNVQNTALLSEPESKDPDTRRLKKLVASIIPSPSGEIDAKVVLAGMEALAASTESREDEDVRRKLGEMEVIPILVGLIMPTTSPPLLASTLTVLVHLTRSKENRERVRTAAFLPKLVNLLKMSRHLLKNSLVKQKTIQLTINVATSNPTNKLLLQREGAPAVLGKLLKDQAGYAFDPSEVFRFAALALSVVCTVTMPEDIKKAVVKAGGVDGLVAGIHPDHPEVTRTVLTALEMLTANCADVKERVRTRGGITQLVAVVGSTHADRVYGPTLAALACSTLAKLSANNATNAEAIRECDGALQVFVGIASTADAGGLRDVRAARLHAATCVMHLTKYDELSRHLLREEGLLPQVMRLSLSMDDSVAERGVWTLSNMCSKNTINQQAVMELEGTKMLMMALARKELMERQHRKLLRGLLATVVHLCELSEAVEAFLQAGALTTVLFFTLVLSKESVTAPETDLAILTLRFLSANNKKAQRIIRHMGGAELAICVQEGSLYSASVPDAPLETRYKLQLDDGKITKQFVPPHLRIKAAAALQLTPPSGEVVINPMTGQYEDADGTLTQLIASKGGALNSVAPSSRQDSRASSRLPGRGASPLPMLTAEASTSEFNSRIPSPPGGDGASSRALVVRPSSATQGTEGAASVGPSSMRSSVPPRPHSAHPLRPGGRLSRGRPTSSGGARTRPSSSGPGRSGIRPGSSSSAAFSMIGDSYVGSEDGTDTTLMSSPMTTPNQSEAPTPYSSRPGTAQAMQLTDAPHQEHEKDNATALVRTDAIVTVSEGAAEEADKRQEYLMGPYTQLGYLEDGNVMELALRDDVEELKYQKAIKAKLAKRAHKDYGALIEYDLESFKEEVLRREIQAEIERTRKAEDAYREEQERQMAEAEAVAAEARNIQQRAIASACFDLVSEVVDLASAEAEAMLAMDNATKAIDQMREGRRTVELSAKAMERSKGSTEVVRANKNLELALEVSTKAQAVVLANVDVLVCEADLTEQWQLGPQMVLSQGLRLVPESHKLLEEMRAIQERVGPLFRRKNATIKLVEEILFQSMTNAVLCSELMYDVVDEVAELCEVRRRQEEEEERRRLEIMKRMEMARLQAVESFCSSLIVSLADEAADYVEAEQTMRREELAAREQALRQQLEDHEKAMEAARLRYNISIPDQLLVACVLAGDAEGVCALAKVANVQQKTTGGYTLLHEAAEQGNPVIVDALLASGANVHARTTRGSPVIITAAMKGNGDVVRALLAYGADPNQINRDRESPLHAAVKGGHADATYALLEGGADILEPDTSGNSALHVAAACSWTSTTVQAIVDYAIQHEMHVTQEKADVNHLIEVGSNQDVVDGAAKGNPNDPKSASNKRIRAITAAVAKRAHEFGPRVGNHTMVASRRGASAPSCSVLHLRNQYDVTPLHVVAAMGHAEAMEYMLERGAPLDPVDARSFTPLHLAAYRGHAQCAALLLGCGASTVLKTMDGLTARDLACGPTSNVQTRKVLNYATGTPELHVEDWGHVHISEGDIGESDRWENNT